MSLLHPHLEDALHQPAPFSFWRHRMKGLAGSQSLQSWLVTEANLRGFFGAYQNTDRERPTEGVSLEEIVVGLCAPQAPAEGRIFKLVLRILQSGRLNLRRLYLLARREKAHLVLWWLLQQTPKSEQSAPIQELIREFEAPPRGYRGLEYEYDCRRLIRRPFRMVNK